MVTKKAALPATLSYAEIIRMKMKTGDNPTRKPISTKQLAEHLGVSYEHVRQILQGKPALSRELSNKLCAYIGAEPEAMWHKVITERFQKKAGFTPQAPSGAGRLAELWPELSDANRAVLEQMAEAMVAANRMTTRRALSS